MASAFVVVTERQEVVEVGAVGDAPGKVLRDDRRLEALTDETQPLQMRLVET